MAGEQIRRVRNGVTLAELTIVVLIIGIMAAVAVPTSFRSISQFRAEAAAKRIASDLMYARQIAMNQGLDQPVVFTVSTNSYSMPSVPHPNNPSQAYSVDLASTDYPATMVAVSFGGSITVTFHYNGQPDAAGSVTVASGGYQKLVALDAVTGRVTVQ